MNTRNGSASFVGVVLALIIIVSSLSPSDTTTTTVIIIEEAFEPSILKRIDLRGFEPSEKRRLLKALPAKFTNRCTEAFKDEGLLSPLEVALTTGFVLHPSRDLWDKEIGSLGFVSERTKIRYKSEFSTCRAQAGTVPAMRDGWKLTVDGRARVFIHDSAYAGESFWFNRFSLEDVLTHELIHVGGQRATPGWLGPLSHDLKGFEPHDKILEACR